MAVSGSAESLVALPSISILILNWNDCDDTLECLESVYRSTYPRYEIIVIDNGSTDNSIQRIREYCSSRDIMISRFPDTGNSHAPVHLLEYSEPQATHEVGDTEQILYSSLPSHRKMTLIVNAANRGFAEGSNIGMMHAMAMSNPDYVLLLNNDTVVDENLLGELVESAEKDKTIGFAGPKIYYYNLDGRTDVIRSAGCETIMALGKNILLGNREIDQGQHDAAREVDCVGGSCLFARSEMIRSIGMLDPAFFAYWEENDWCARGAEAGYRTVYVPHARIWHKTGKRARAALREYYMTRNRFLFMKKHGTPIQNIQFLLYFFALSMWMRLGLLSIRGNHEAVLSSFIKGIVDGVRCMRS